MKTEFLIKEWFKIMSCERDFFTYALELAIINNVPYAGRLGIFNPKTQTFQTSNGFVMYITPDYRRRLMVMFNNLIQSDYVSDKTN